MKATIVLSPTPDLSKVDRRDWSRELWTLAYRQSRSMIRAGASHGIGQRSVWCQDHLRRRFGASGWPVAQYAARLVVELRTPAYALGGGVADFHRQGLTNAAGQPTRALFVEKLSGWRMAWSANPLAAVNANRSLRALRARQRREERAAIQARLEAEERLYVLTEAGVAALVAAGMAEDRVALTGGGSLALA